MSIIDNIKTRGVNQKIKLKEAKLRLELLESMPEFAKDNDEKDWMVVGSQDYEEYTTNQIDTLRQNAQILYYTSPLARGIITMIVNFVIGSSFEIVPADDDEKVKAYWEKFWSDNKMDMRVKEFVKRTLRDGENFLRFFPGKGKEPVPLVRFIRTSQISDKNNKHTYGIETDPNDVETVIRYYRNYNDPDGQQASETIDAKDMIHTKIMVDSDVKRGLSFLIGVMKYIKDYTDWLNDRKHLNKIRTIFNLIAKPTGATTAGTFGTNMTDSLVKSTSGGSNTYNKKLPKSGSLISSKGVEYDFKSLNLNAADTQHDGRAMLLMIVAGSNLAEYMVTGDNSNNNYASAMISEAPAVKAFEAWQDFFSHPFKEIYKKVIMDAVDANILPDKYEKKTSEWDIDKKIMIEKIESVLVTGECELQFPILIHRDIEAETKSFTIQNQFDIVSKKTISAKLGYDYENEKKELIREAQEAEMMESPDDEHDHEPPAEEE